MEFQTIVVIVYLAGVVGAFMAGEKRTIGGFGAAGLALLATPLVGGVLLLSWPSKIEAEEYYEKKVAAAKASTASR